MNKLLESGREIDELCSLMLFAKIGWCENYDGSEVPKGRQAYLNVHQDGWDRFNFKALGDGRCYGYLVPSGGENLPAVEPRSGWTIIFVAPLEGRGDLSPVGFYLNATIESGYVLRPEYNEDGDFPLDARHEDYLYCLSAEVSDAYLIRGMNRESSYPKIPGRHFGSAAFRYGSRDGDQFSREYYGIGRQIVELGRRLEWPLICVFQRSRSQIPI